MKRILPVLAILLSLCGVADAETFTSAVTASPKTSAYTGTEFLPIIQSGVTKHDSLAGLTAYIQAQISASLFPSIVTLPTLANTLQSYQTKLSPGVDYLTPIGNGSQLTGITAAQIGAATPSAVSTAVTNIQTYLLGFLQQNYTLQVASAGALRGLTGFSGVVVHRSGFYAAGDGGAADYTFNATACATDDGGSCLNALGSGSWHIDWSSVHFEATPQLFGAQFKNDGSTNSIDIAAFVASINTGLTVHFPGLRPDQSFTMNKCVTFSVFGQVLYGDGGASQIIENPGLDASCRGLFQVPVGGMGGGPVIKNIRIVHGQPDVTSKAQLITYKPDFWFENTPGFKLLSVECWAATECVDMKGNSGGAIIDDFKFSAYKIGIDINGALDTVIISRPHWFPYFMNQNQQNLFISEGGVTFTTPHSNTGNGYYNDSPVSNSLNFNALTNGNSQQMLPVIGTYRLVAQSATSFNLIDPNGNVAQQGVPTDQNIRNVFNYSIVSGSTPFAAGDEFDIVVNDVPAIGINCGRMDDIKIVNGLFLGGIGVNLYQTAGGPDNYNNGGTCGGHIANIDFDTTSGIIMSQGTLSGSGVTFAMYQHAQGLDVTGGTLSLGNGFVIEANHDGKPMLHFGGDVGNFYELSDFAFLTTVDIFNIYQDGGFLHLMGNRFSRPQSGNFSNPMVYLLSTRTTAIGNSTRDAGSATGQFIYAPFDSLWNKFIGNSGVGWGNTYPSGTTMGYYAGNN